MHTNAMKKIYDTNKMSSSYQVPYETGAQLLNCDKVKEGYNRSYYSLDPSCNGIVPSCDNRSYSAYATDSAYQGYYDNCFIGQPEKPQCDLTYVNAPPRITKECWKSCCDQKTNNCNEDCHVSCVVNSANANASKPTPPPLKK
jgi:hypothetical protein